MTEADLYGAQFGATAMRGCQEASAAGANEKADEWEAEQSLKQQSNNN